VPTSQRQQCCIIHGHFYQPPRENPWLDIIEKQDSAAPYHDWNERIYDECYRPNAFSRLLDNRGMIRGIHNNYRNLSFNFGPTLFSWLERHHPSVATRIIEADRESCQRLEGHGNAIAQVYNHLIMPLASVRDQYTQIRWGKAFFRKRFGRDPEGMWLAETAINRRTVECLINEEIRFVVLSPAQAEACRPMMEGGQWVHTSAQPVDPRRAYRLFHGGHGRGYLDVFFFDEGLSRATSFENLLVDARTMGDRIKAGFNDHATENQAVVIATDGETFGHHKPLSDMCLSFFFTEVAPKIGIVPVNFGYFLAKNPPRFEVNIKNGEGEGTAWSCGHGTGRWSRDCGCSTGGRWGWNQAWRGPLRNALAKLQSRIDAAFERSFRELGLDPWPMRDAYVNETSSSGEVLQALARSRSGNREHTGPELQQMRRLLEAQKFMLFSFTSCGWFFADISGLEAMQNLAYAARAAQLGLDENTRNTAIEELLGILEQARSNIGGNTGRSLFTRHIAPCLHHLERVAFAAVAERLLSGRRTASVHTFGFEAGLTPAMSRQVRQKHYDVFRVDIANSGTGESGSFAIMVAHTRGEEMTGYVLPPAQGVSPLPAGLIPSAWLDQSGALVLHMSDFFLTSRQTLSKYYHKKIDQETLSVYSDWMQRHQKTFETLAVLDDGLRSPLNAPVQFVYSTHWNRNLKSLRVAPAADAVIGRLQTIHDRVAALGVALDYSYSTAHIEHELGAALDQFAKTFDARSAGAVRLMLDIADRFCVPIAKSHFEDRFHTMIATSIKPEYDHFVGSNRTDQAKKEQLARSLDLARRMNFNTDAFPLDR
jgi:hypothetical protein